MNRTIENCILIKKIGRTPLQCNSKCIGFAKSQFDDEPCKTCKYCKLNQFYEGQNKINNSKKDFN
jgi:homoserine trans-succinylase